jgi:hypothetical protein
MPLPRSPDTGKPALDAETRRRGDAETRGELAGLTDAPIPPSPRLPLSPPPRPPSSRQSVARLRELQRLTASAIIRPLARDQHTQRQWTDGRPMKQVVAGFIKPNDRLTSYERLEIYNRQYWFRVLDCLYDDYPGLRAILGERKFHKLRIAYLTRYPSASFTLRNLGSRLEQFLREEPGWTHPLEAMCLDMARFEWAQIAAFDGEAKPALSVDDLLGKNPAKLRLALQPYLSILQMQFPLDDFVLAVKKRNTAMRSEASNAMEARQTERPTRRPRLPKPLEVFVGVHRFNNDLYYKRMSRPQFRLLTALHEGSPLEQACEVALADQADESLAAEISGWFKTWMELGWFCRRE